MLLLDNKILKFYTTNVILKTNIVTIKTRHKLCKKQTVDTKLIKFIF